MPRRDGPLRVLCLLALTLLCAPALAQDLGSASQRLGEIQQSIQKAAKARAALGARASAIADELDKLRRTLLASETAMRKQQQALRDIQATLLSLTEDLAAKRKALAAQRDELALVLSALERIAHQPAEMLLALPTSPTDTHRSAMLLAALTPELHAKAREIAAKVHDLMKIKIEIDAQKAARTAALKALAAEQAASADALARKQQLLAGLQRRDETLAAQQADLSKQAKSLQDLLDKLAKRASQQKTQRDAAMSAAIEALAASRITTAKGQLALPVAGTITAHFGDRLANGSTSEGLTIQTAAGARVVTPYDGQVVFSGKFGDYGHLLIIDHGEGYDTVLAGFARADVVLGQWLLAGEPVAQMATNDKASQRLYVELRRNGKPINPLPWMAAGTNEVSGG